MTEILIAITAAGVAAGYFTIAALIVPRIQLLEATPRFVRAFRIGGVAFFVGCGLTHTHIAYHAVADDRGFGAHELVFHLLQVFGVWVFIWAALRFLEVRVVRRKTQEELEAEGLRERVLSLSRSNEDLEQFAHVVAHDLQEPLRTISGFAELLERDLDGRLDENGRQSLHLIRDGTHRMGALLDGVLAYSRVASVGLERTPVDLDDLLREAQDTLRHTLEARGARVTSEPLGVVHGDRTQLGQLLQNLLANGIKFGAPDAPHVHVSAEEAGGWLTICVRDDGAGIDERDRERVFGMFERGSTADGAGGTGIGLALCAKIVERHGGRIGHEPAPGGGTVFRVSLLRADAIGRDDRLASRPLVAGA